MRALNIALIVAGLILMRASYDWFLRLPELPPIESPITDYVSSFEVVGTRTVTFPGDCELSWSYEDSITVVHAKCKNGQIVTLVNP